jgi:hypothetical protein
MSFSVRFSVTPWVAAATLCVACTPRLENNDFMPTPVVHVDAVAPAHDAGLHDASVGARDATVDARAPEGGVDAAPDAMMHEVEASLPETCGNHDSHGVALDCGAGCIALCEDRLPCRGDADCESQVCTAHLCQKPTCDDAARNGLEVGIDCGDLSNCGPCDDGQTCDSAADCAGGACIKGKCAPATCSDGQQNGSETAEDCGGKCSACQDGQTCMRHTDCESLLCQNDGEGHLVCQEPSCEDRVQNSDEADIDCGGSCDKKCELGQRCSKPDDCEQRACGIPDGAEQPVCVEPTCDDGTKNGKETAIDCGGPGDCERCDVGKVCRADGDCQSHSCDGTCLDPTCTDQRTNGSETDEDCGGSSDCARCAALQACNNDGDCLSMRCSEDGICEPGSAGSVCRSEDDCLSGSCPDETCAPGSAGEACLVDGDCSTQSCAEDSTCAQVYTTGSCQLDDDCYAGRCVEGACGVGEAGRKCTSPSQCASGICSDEQCQPLDLVVQSNGTYNGVEEIAVEFTLAKGSVSVAWADVAVLYFFEFADPPTDTEAAHSDMGQHYMSDSVASHRCVGVGGPDWIYVWQGKNSGDIGSEYRFTIKLNNKLDGVNQQLDPTNDYSYRSGLGPSDKLVICRKVGTEWYQVQGTGPSSIQKPCQYVDPDCDAVVCDELN